MISFCGVVMALEHKPGGRVFGRERRRKQMWIEGMGATRILQLAVAGYNSSKAYAVEADKKGGSSKRGAAVAGWALGMWGPH